MKKLIVSLILTLSLINVSNAEVKFNEVQKEHLAAACDYGYDVVIDSGHLCYIFAAVIWEESSAGTILNGGPGHRAYGVFQNHIKTVRNRARQKGLNLSDKDLINMLQDFEVSAYYAEEELRYWLKQHNGDLTKALASYNVGWNYKLGLGYAKSVKEKARYLYNNRDLLGLR